MNASAGPIVLAEAEIRAMISARDALAAVRGAVLALHDGRVTQPPPLHLEFPAARGEAHVKAAHVDGEALWSVKVATGFYANPEAGLPVGGGVVLVLSAATGIIHAVLIDNGFLTDLRTGALGALGADLLARRGAARAAVVGCGTQARFQLAALVGVRELREVKVAGRDATKTRRFANEMRARLRLPVVAASSVEEAARGADLIVTTTPARSPVLRSEWVENGCHVTAVGADGAGKQELDPELLARAELVATDSLNQALSHGEVGHAVREGLLDAAAVSELGTIAAGRAPGRSSEAAITVCDLTGIGAADTAVATLVAARAAVRAPTAGGRVEHSH